MAFVNQRYEFQMLAKSSRAGFSVSIINQWGKEYRYTTNATIFNTWAQLQRNRTRENVFFCVANECNEELSIRKTSLQILLCIQ